MLSSYITESGRSSAWWARRWGVSASYLSLLRSGKKTASLPLAQMIEADTGGAVTALSLIRAGDLLSVPDTAPMDAGCEENKVLGAAE